MIFAFSFSVSWGCYLILVKMGKTQKFTSMFRMDRIVLMKDFENPSHPVNRCKKNPLRTCPEAVIYYSKNWLAKGEGF